LTYKRGVLNGTPHLHQNVKILKRIWVSRERPKGDRKSCHARLRKSFTVTGKTIRHLKEKVYGKGEGRDLKRR